MNLMEYSTRDRERAERIKGCLLGGAVGDALGGPIEFFSLEKIRKRFGPTGVTGFGDYRKAGISGVGQITDDTQMTLFTAEGLLRAYSRWRDRGICHPPTVIYHAYLRWLHTQGMQSKDSPFEQDDGWLIRVPELHHRRAPGNTCLVSLQSGKMGSLEDPINQSKGCGGVMRAAPIGLLGRVDDPFSWGMESAAITHGHPSGYLAAGCLAQMVHDLIEGASLGSCLDHVFHLLQNKIGGEECALALHHAIQLWEEGRGTETTAEWVETLGAGWVAEEALAIGVYCAIFAGDDFAQGIRLAVNHSGDSDSTGSIAGNLLGASLGKDAIPVEWLETLELREVIETIAVDLAIGFQDNQKWWNRYPGW